MFFQQSGERFSFVLRILPYSEAASFGEIEKFVQLKSDKSHRKIQLNRAIRDMRATKIQTSVIFLTQYCSSCSMDGWTDGRSYIHTHSPCILQVITPFSAAALPTPTLPIQNGSSGKGNRRRCTSLVATGFSSLKNLMKFFLFCVN